MQPWPVVEPPILTTTLVVGEFATLLGRQIEFKRAADRVKLVYESQAHDILEFTREDEMEALTWMNMQTTESGSPIAFLSQ